MKQLRIIENSEFMIKTILTASLVIAAAAVFGERIDGPANIRKEVKGAAIFLLYDNVEVDLGELKNDWYELVISVTLTEKQFESGIIRKGDKLYRNKQEIGVALIDVDVSSKYSGGGAPDVPKWYGAELYGYTYKGNVKPESVVEPAISKLIEDNRESLDMSVFKEHMKYFGYVDGLAIKDMGKYVTYMIYESILDDISPLDRIRLIFEDQQLIAVVHSRNLAISGVDTVEIERGRKLTLLKVFNPSEKTTFIQKNKESYWGVD